MKTSHNSMIILGCTILIFCSGYSHCQNIPEELKSEQEKDKKSFERIIMEDPGLCEIFPYLNYSIFYFSRKELYRYNQYGGKEVPNSITMYYPHIVLKNKEEILVDHRFRGEFPSHAYKKHTNIIAPIEYDYIFQTIIRLLNEDQIKVIAEKTSSNILFNKAMKRNHNPFLKDKIEAQITQYPGSDQSILIKKLNPLEYPNLIKEILSDPYFCYENKLAAVKLIGSGYYQTEMVNIAMDNSKINQHTSVYDKYNLRAAAIERLDPFKWQDSIQHLILTVDVPDYHKIGDDYYRFRIAVYKKVLDQNILAEFALNSDCPQNILAVMAISDKKLIKMVKKNTSDKFVKDVAKKMPELTSDPSKYSKHESFLFKIRQYCNSGYYY